MAAASVSSTLRASARSTMDAGLGLLHDAVDRRQALEKWLEAIESQRVLRVALRARWIVVHLEKHPVDARGDARGCEWLDEVGVTGRDAVAAAGPLEAMRHVEDDRHAAGTHDREAAHVDDQRVIAEARSALGHDDS